jgi:hypothetical protein
MEAFPGGSVTSSTAPTFQGHTEDLTDPVTVSVYEGETASGKPVRATTAYPSPLTGSWSATVITPLDAGTYTAVAEQSELAGAGEGTVSPPYTFTTRPRPPMVTIDQPPSPSNNTTPSFSGTASDRTPVVVRIYAGSTPEGPEIATAGAVGTGGAWSSGPASPALPSGENTFTAVATQVGPLGGPQGITPPVTFTVDTLSPAVTLKQLASPSNNTTPSFSGTATDTTPVTVNVYRGTTAEGTPTATVRAQGTGGGWTSANVSPPLEDGEYTAVAAQPSSLGNAGGVSKPMTFEVRAAPPAVTLRSPPSPSNNTTPSFSGTASEATPVTVEVFEGTRPEGNIIATATAPGTHAGFTSAAVTPALPRGRHAFTAVAVQTSALGNPPGKSAPVAFVVNTEAPAVTLKAPPSPSNNTTPSFSGTASEPTTVTIEVFEGPRPEGKLVATAAATPTDAAGDWSSDAASPALANGTFTAIATQPSAIGNAAGRSAAVTFTVDTSAPTVTLNALPTPSGNRAPSFSGSASDHTPVTIDIYKGSAADGEVVASATAEVVHGEWTSPRATPSLEWGEYTALARQPSSIGNTSGASSPVSFAVQPIAPSVASEAAAAVTRTSAALYASVDPAGGPVNACYFEYGTTTAYGQRIECGFVSEIAAFPPAGTAAVPVFARIFGLHPSTTYHFRIVAVGEGGTGVGADEAFTTMPPFVFPEEASAARAPKPVGAAAHPRTVGARKLAALIAREVAPRGRMARISALLASGEFKAPFTAPEAGSARLDWYYDPPAARRFASAARSPLLVATGSFTFRTAATATVRIRLTDAGRRILGASTRVRLTATCLFKPLAAGPVKSSAAFELRR